MGFIGIILNLEILVLLQIVYSKINVQYELILVTSIFFLLLSLIVATFAYRQVLFKNLSTRLCLEEEFINKSKEELLELISKNRLKDIEENKKLIHQRARCVHVSSYDQPASNLKKYRTFKINDTNVIINSSSSIETTPKTAKVFVRGKCER